MYCEYTCFQAWKSLQELENQTQCDVDDDVVHIIYNDIDYNTYCNVWNQCVTRLSSTAQHQWFYDDDFLFQVFCEMESPKDSHCSIEKTIQSDVCLITTVSLTPLGRIQFLPLYRKMESFLICLLGHSNSSLRGLSTVLLNVL